MGDREMHAAVYVHFPFCLRKCSYCDFASDPVRRELVPHDAYARAVIREWHLRNELLGKAVSPTSVYFGGGTPSLWASWALARVIQEISQGGLRGGGLEVTAECNPCSVGTQEIVALRDAGVTRLSVGVQSLDPARLALLGRAHDGAQALATLAAARAARFASVSADMIYGAPGEAVRDAVQDAEELVGAGVDHVSAYMLTVPGESSLAAGIRSGQISAPDDGVAAEAFVAVSDWLTAAGYEHYEVSNFARAGFESQHNLWVWRGGPYVGLGAGAVGCARLRDGRVVRTRNTRNAARYMEAVKASSAADLAEAGGVVEEAEELEASTLLCERIMLGLRLAEGVDIRAAGEELGAEGWTRRRLRAARMLEGRGRLRIDGDRVTVPRRQWIWEGDTAAWLA
jgi:putative oxygen-independent coproporphyrinogen III oxidase